MTDPFSILWPLVDHPDAVVSWQTAAWWPAGVRDTLFDLGLLREVEPARFVTCPECREHDGEVIAFAGPNGETRYAIPCPEVLRAEVTLEELRQWRIDFPRITSVLAEGLHLGGKPAELVPGRLWRLGRWSCRETSRDMLLGRGFGRADAETLRRAVTGSRKPVVFVPWTAPASGFWAGKSPPIILLPEVTSCTDGVIDFDVEEILFLVLDADGRSSEQSTGSESLSLVVDRKVRSAIKSQLTDDLVIQTYLASGSSARKAAKELKQQGFPIHHSTVSRIVGRYQDVLQAGSSESVVRTRSSQRRDTPIKNRD